MAFELEVLDECQNGKFTAGTEAAANPANVFKVMIAEELGIRVG